MLTGKVKAENVFFWVRKTIIQKLRPWPDGRHFYRSVGWGRGLRHSRSLIDTACRIDLPPCCYGMNSPEEEPQESKDIGCFVKIFWGRPGQRDFEVGLGWPKTGWYQCSSIYKRSSLAPSCGRTAPLPHSSERNSNARSTDEAFMSQTPWCQIFSVTSSS